MESVRVEGRRSRDNWLDRHIKAKHARGELKSRPNAVFALEREYQWLLGELSKLESAQYEWEGRDQYEEAHRYWKEKRNSLLERLVNIESTIRLYNPHWDRSRMVPKRSQETRRLLDDATQFQIAMWAHMRAAGEPVKVSEIAQSVAAKLALPYRDGDEKVRIYRMVYATLHSYRSKGLVKSDLGRPARWSIVESTSQAERDFLEARGH